MSLRQDATEENFVLLIFSCLPYLKARPRPLLRYGLIHPLPGFLASEFILLPGFLGSEFVLLGVDMRSTSLRWDANSTFSGKESLR